MNLEKVIRGLIADSFRDAQPETCPNITGCPVLQNLDLRNLTDYDIAYFRIVCKTRPYLCELNLREETEIRVLK